MPTELPVCRRCCFCLPLRYGLIGWGYIRLIMAILMMIRTSVIFYVTLGMAINYSSYTIHVVILGFLVLLLLSDVILNVLFIVGGHKKNRKLLKAYFIYSLIVCIVTTLVSTGVNIYSWCVYFTSEDWRATVQYNYVSNVLLVMLDVAGFIAQIAIQVYILLLVRSEIIKLKSKCQFRFVNNAAESECSMRCNREITSGEEDREEFCNKDTP